MDNAIDFIIENAPFYGLPLYVGLQLIAIVLAPKGAWQIAAYIPLVLAAPLAIADALRGKRPPGQLRT